MGLFSLAASVAAALILVVAAVRKVDIIRVFTEGAREGLTAAWELFPVLLLVVTAVSMIYRSGALNAFASILSPLVSPLGYPAEILPLAIIRPVSGSGALALFNNILSAEGPDTFIGRAASVLMGSTETTFYTIAVYFAAVKLKADAGVFISSLTADTAGFVFSAVIVRLFY